MNEKIILNTASGSKLGSVEDLELIQENQAESSRKELKTAQSKTSEHSGRTKHGDESRASSHRGSHQRGREQEIDKIWTEEELLADEDLWHVTDSEGSESDEKSSK